MKTLFPTLPSYGFSWRSILVEPIPASGERITVGILVKGEDRTLVATRLLPVSKIRSMYGQEFGRRVTDALSLCINNAEKYYKSHPLSNNWEPPLQGFFLGDLNSSMAEDIENALTVASMQCSSFSVSLEGMKLNSNSNPE